MGGALTGLRAAIETRVKTVRGTVLRYSQHHHAPRAYEAQDDAKAALDVELARVEARIDRLVRLVRAWDELASVETRTFDMPGDSYNAARFVATTDLWTAREAITEDDLT